MAGASNTFHEDPAVLSSLTRDIHRALVSLQEELEAVDSYRQRAEVCADGELRALLAHNMREEIEHAAMLLEWLRRTDPDFDTHLGTYLYSEGSIIEAEEAATAGNGLRPAARAAPLGLTLGSLKETTKEDIQ